MPSSTSSSESLGNIPARPWLSLFAVSLVVVAGAAGLWERQVRAWGYEPTYNDTPNLWAELRARASGAGPEQIVFAGTSRALFDMDLHEFHEVTGGPLPIQLATVGSNPLVVLGHLAADPTYAGTTIVDIVPGLIAAAGGPPIEMPAKFTKHYDHWSPAARMELPLVLALQDHLAFINEGDLSLGGLLDHRLRLSDRAGVYAPELPAYMHTLDRNRQGRMAEFVARDPEAMHKVQQTWMVLGNPPPRPQIFSEEQWANMMQEGWKNNLRLLREHVRAITARGGRVIFQRLPSTDRVLERENERFPREMIWEAILRETGAPGVYFEDYPELRGFHCPEWSHLDAAGSVEYSRRLVRIMKAEKLL